MLGNLDFLSRYHLKISRTQIVHSTFISVLLGLFFFAVLTAIKKNTNEKLFGTIASAVSYQLQIGEYRQAYVFLENSATNNNFFVELKMNNENKIEAFGLEKSLFSLQSRVNSSPLHKETFELKFSYGLETEFFVSIFLIGMTFASVLILIGKLQKENDRRRRLEVAYARDSAIARVTQSLAHDVRKPFSMFKMIIDVVECEEDPLEAKQLLKESLPEVQQAIASVNGMISDVLEIGSESAAINASFGIAAHIAHMLCG